MRRDKVRIKKIKDKNEDFFIKKLNNIYNLWDVVEILHLDWEYKNYKAVILCKDEEKQ